MHLGVLGGQFVDKGNVVGFGLFLRHPLLVFPGLPLGLALEVHDAGLVGGVVTDGGLLVQPVQLEQFVVVGTSGQLVDGLSLIWLVGGNTMRGQLTWFHVPFLQIERTPLLVVNKEKGSTTTKSAVATAAGGWCHPTIICRTPTSTRLSPYY